MNDANAKSRRTSIPCSSDEQRVRTYLGASKRCNVPDDALWWGEKLNSHSFARAIVEVAQFRMGMAHRDWKLV